jgi:hypothetical protein
MTDTVSNYIHSRIVTEVIDNSIVEEETGIGVGFVLYQPFFSYEGDTGSVRTYNTDTGFIRRNGKPNMARDGQQIYNALQWLKGGGTLLGLRLTADNALPAFGCINIRTKPCDIIVREGVAEDLEAGTPMIPEISIPGLKISPTLSPVPTGILTPTLLSLSESLSMKQIASLLQSQTTPSTEFGWTDHFLTIFRVRGAGEYGKNFGVSISLDGTREEDLEDARRYFVGFIKKNNLGNIETVSEAMSVSFYPNAVDSSGLVSEFLDVVVSTDKYKKTFDSVATYTDDESYNNLIEELTKYTGAIYDEEDVISEEQEPTFVDVFSLLDRKLRPYVRFIPADEDDIEEMIEHDVPQIDFSQLEAFLSGGDDGDLDSRRYIIGEAPVGYSGPNKYFPTKKICKEALESVRQSLMQRAYRGDIDRNIISDYKYQISAIIDANNNEETKKEMVYLCRRRLDIIAYLDCGMVSSCAASIVYRNNMLAGINDWNASIWPQSGTAYDGYNLRDISVTHTYDIAFKLPYLYTNAGPHKLMAGVARGNLATMKTLNWLPDEDEKTELYKNQMNYVEEVRINQLAIMSVRTAYVARTSYLSVIRNTHAMCDVIWLGRQVLTDLRYEEEASLAMTQAVERINQATLYLILNGPMKSLNVKAEQTQMDVINNTASVTFTASFKDFIHTWKFYVVAAR